LFVLIALKWRWGPVVIEVARQPVRQCGRRSIANEENCTRPEGKVALITGGLDRACRAAVHAEPVFRERLAAIHRRVGLAA
jgi:hypothetical protein